MRIAVNTRLLISDKLDGIGWFTHETMKRITQQHPEHEFYFLFDRKFEDQFIYSSNIQPVSLFPPARHPVLWLAWFEYSVTRMLKKINPDLFLSPDGYLSLSTSVKSLPVIHDINFHHRPLELPVLTRHYYTNFFPRFAKKACRIATVSEYSAADIAASYGVSPTKIDVVYNGANERYVPINESHKQKTRDTYTESKPYFLFVGSLIPRKNIPRLLLAFNAFRNSNPDVYKLVIVGHRMFLTDEITNTLNLLEFKDDVVFTGRLAPDALHEVLASAFALTFVPVFEGFGIPILEALYCDVPVIASGITSMPEVAGEAAVYVDPYDVPSITAAMQKVAGNQKLRQELIEKGRLRRKKFSWQKSADNLWKSIENCNEANT